VLDVRIIGGGLPVFPQYQKRRCPVRCLEVGDFLGGGMFKSVDVLVFEVPAVSSVVLLFFLRTSWNPSSCIVCCPARMLALSRSLNSSKVTV
jgi:hypothetical protein